MDQGEPEANSLSAKIDYLFRTVHPRGRGEYTYREVSKEIEAMGGPTISASYLHQLRTGIKDNPSIKHVEALAKFFGVPPEYFFDASVQAGLEQQLALLATLRDHDVTNLALRATGLSDRGKALIAEVIERTRELESGQE